ncbi:MAG: hypothetical protein HOQ05_03210 [Corynebacteriales bacterium]|nr:hypothetical protein [Mycobacteriales bacterium]
MESQAAAAVRDVQVRRTPPARPQAVGPMTVSTAAPSATRSVSRSPGQQAPTAARSVNVDSRPPREGVGRAIFAQLQVGLTRLSASTQAAAATAVSTATGQASVEQSVSQPVAQAPRRRKL